MCGQVERCLAANAAKRAQTAPGRAICFCSERQSAILIFQDSLSQRFHIIATALARLDLDLAEPSKCYNYPGDGVDKFDIPEFPSPSVSILGHFEVASQGLRELPIHLNVLHLLSNLFVSFFHCHSILGSRNKPLQGFCIPGTGVRVLYCI